MRTSKLTSFLALSLVPMIPLIMACPGDDQGTETGGATTTEGTTTGTTTTGTTTTGTTTTGTTTTGTTEGETTTATTEATTATTTVDTTAGTTEGETTAGTTAATGGMAALDAAMSDLQISQDCMPVVPADPTDVTFMLELTNTGDMPVGAMVTSATFQDAGGVEVGTIEVMPEAFGPVPVDGSTMEMVTKVDGSLLPANGCDVVMCDTSYTLELVLDVDGAEVLVSDSAVVECVF